MCDNASPHRASLPCWSCTEVDVVAVERYKPIKGEVGGRLSRASFSPPYFVLLLLCESSLWRSSSPPWELPPAWKLSLIAPSLAGSI